MSFISSYSSVLSRIDNRPNKSEFMISNYESTKNESTRLKRFTVSYALKNGFFNLVRYFLVLGLDPNLVDKRSPLIYCTFIKDEAASISIVQNLLEYGAEMNQVDTNGLNVLHYTCAFGLDKLLKILLKSLDFDFSKSVDSMGNSPMHYAVRSHNLKCVQLLLDKCRQYKISNIDSVVNRNGLKASDLEDPSESSKYQRIFSGTDSLKSCKQLLIEFTLNETAEKRPTQFDDYEDVELVSNSTFFQTEISSYSTDKSHRMSTPLKSSQFSKEKAKKLTQQSFLICLNDRLDNLIDYNDLFFCKEHFFENLGAVKETRTPVKHFYAKSDYQIQSNWKHQLPNVFECLENFMMPSHRRSARPKVKVIKFKPLDYHNNKQTSNRKKKPSEINK